MSFQRWMNSPAFDRVRWDTQLGRVINAIAGYRYYTLREIERKILEKELEKAEEDPTYQINYDTQAAISARIREVSPSRHGLVKQKTMEVVNGKQVWRYRLMPCVPIRKVAEMIGRAA